MNETYIKQSNLMSPLFSQRGEIQFAINCTYDVVQTYLRNATFFCNKSQIHKSSIGMGII